MHITDTIADMLTRIRNANSAKHDTVDIPASKMKKAIAQILLDEGYIKGFHRRRRRKAGHHPYHPKIRRQQDPGYLRGCAEYPSPACVFIQAVRTCPRS